MSMVINPNEILEQYSNLVYKLALSHVKNAADADDIFQEVFLRLVRTDRRFDSEEHIKAWLIRVTIHCSCNLWRSPWKQKIISMEADMPDELYCDNKQASEIYEQVKSLPIKYRTVIHLFYYEDMSIDTISSMLGIGYQAAAKRLSRARSLLKQQMTEEVDDDEFSQPLSYRRQSTPNS